MDHEALFDGMAAYYLPRILSWAVRKTCSRSGGEELAQEIFSQFFAAARRAERIDKPENLLWKVARYCWCNYLRSGANKPGLVELRDFVRDDTDFVETLISDEEHSMRIAAMRREISNLSSMRREAMILHYLDGLSVADTAKKLNLTEGAVTWHLYDARKNLRRRMESMYEKTDYLYRPGRLGVGYSGDGGPDPDTKRINDSLIRQNLCLLCYREAKSIDELAELTGIPKPYLEYDLDWLEEREFLTREGKKYATAFPIIGKRHMQDIGTLYAAQHELIDKVLDYLWEREDEIRGIGFYGSQFPTERMMWSIITMFISYISRNSPLLTRLKRMDDRPIRPDGGRYIVLASDKSEGQELDPNGYGGEILWGGYCGIMSDSCIPGSKTDRYYWLGVNSFADRQYHPRITVADSSTKALLHWIYTSAAEPWFSADELEPHGKEALAEAVADGLIEKDGDAYKPNYSVFTPEQLERLREDIYRPLMEMLEPVFVRLGDKISAMHRAGFPKINKSYINYHTYVELWDFGIYTLMYAAQDGKIRLPDTPEQAVPLTLVVVK